VTHSREKWIKRAYDISRNSNCARRSVGAVLVRDEVEIIAGTNGVNRRFRDCVDAGCPRCTAGGIVGHGYELCICVHAEQDAISSAAREGIAVEGASAFLTLRPCLTCLTLMVNAGLVRVHFCEDWTYTAGIEAVYRSVAQDLELFESVPVSYDPAVR
jgi:dCMP deaminase